MIKAVIFDLDGTLADSLPDLKSAMNRMLRSFGWQERSTDEIRSFIGKGTRVFVAKSMPDGTFNDMSDDIVNEAVRVYNDYYAECCNEKTRPYEGIPQTLKDLKERGIKLGVLSNKPDSFVKIIIEKLFPDVFDVAMGQGIYPVKPAPDAAFAAAEKLGAAPNECVFIGDSDIDMKTAVNAGMYPLGAGWGYRTAEVLKEAGSLFVANDPLEIVPHIAALPD